MAPHRRSWQKRIPKAFAEARSLKGNELRPKDVVDVLAKELQTVERRHITDNVAKYVKKGPDGIYGILASRSQTIRRSSPAHFQEETVTTSFPLGKQLTPSIGQSSSGGPALVPDEILLEILHVRRTPFWKKLVEEADFIRDLEGE